MPEPQATFEYQPGHVEDVLEFLKRTRFELRMLRMVRVWPDRIEIFDVNGDTFEVRGVGYPHPDVIPILDNINTAFKRESIHEPTGEPYKEFKTGRRYCWAADRVM
jgi:hypothetical protein